MSENDLVGLREVRAREAHAIKTRREVAGLVATKETAETASAIPSDLFGVSLSGGGLRSACFSIGFIQALHRAGLWRYVDYLSSVSGGGYIAGYLSAALTNRKAKFTECDFPLRDLDAVNDCLQPFDATSTTDGETGMPESESEKAAGDDARHLPARRGAQSPAVQRFIYGGNYLLRPILFLNRYLVGLVLINLPTFSFVFMVAAAVAWLWRCLDYPWVRRQAALLDLDSDLIMPFLPAFVFGLAWLIAWIISLWRRNDLSTGHSARRILYLFIPSLLVGCALVIGNGDTSGVGVQTLTGQPDFSVPASVWAPLVTLLGAALLPWLNPQRILQSGINPQKPWEKYVFFIATTALLVGVPLVLVGWLARENISGYNTHPYRPIAAGELAQPQQLASLFLPAPNLIVDDTPDDPQTNGVIYRHMDYLLEASKKARSANEGTGNQLKKRLEDFQDLRASVISGPHNMKSYVANDASWRSVAGPASLEIPEAPPLAVAALFTDEAREALRTLRKQRSRTSRELLQLRCLLYSAAAAHIATVEHARAVEQVRHETDFSLAGEMAFVRHAFETAGYWAGLQTSNSAQYYSEAIDAYWQTREMLAQSFEACVLSEPKVTGELLAEAARVPDVAEAVEQAFAEWQRTGSLPEDPARLRQIVRASFDALYPGLLVDRDTVRRTITQRHDQWMRLKLLGYASLIFLVSALLVNVNTVSLHRYYRDRIAFGFMNARLKSNRSVPLSALESTNFGGPYHLISGSIRIWRRPIFNQSATQDIGTNETGEQQKDEDLRQQDSFLLSQLYCGSDLTNYLCTEDFDSRTPSALNRIDIADAVAISGAAVAPANVDNPLIAALMMVLNLRLGQWLPNPLCRPPRMPPNVLGLMMSALQPWKRRPYLFVSDGGVQENLGIVQLLRRRCRFIIAVDSSCDPEHTFADFARSVSDVRIHDGIRLVELESDAMGNMRALELSKLRCRKDATSWDEGFVDEHFKVATIKYPDAVDGLLIYVKPSMTGDESIDLIHYRQRWRDFPHQSTSDQFYEPSQVEAYRKLGEHIGTRIARAMGRTPEELWRDSSEVTVEQLVQAFTGFATRRCVADWLRQISESPRTYKELTEADWKECVRQCRCPAVDVASDLGRMIADEQQPIDLRLIAKELLKFAFDDLGDPDAEATGERQRQQPDEHVPDDEEDSLVDH